MDSLTDRTKLVLVSTVNYSTGFRVPARGTRREFFGSAEFSTMSTGRRAWERFDSMFESVQPDMLAVHGYKWLISPNGAGFMYVSPELPAEVTAERGRVAQSQGLAARGQLASWRARVCGVGREVRGRDAELPKPLRNGRIHRSHPGTRTGPDRSSRVGPCREVRAVHCGKPGARLSMEIPQSSQHGSRAAMLRRWRERYGISELWSPRATADCECRRISITTRRISSDSTPRLSTSCDNFRTIYRNTSKRK